MATAVDVELADVVKARVDEELAKVTSLIEGRETKSVTKTVKDVIAAIMPGLASIISVAVSTAVSKAVKELDERMASKLAEVQRQCLLNKYDNDKLEQYSRRENVRISGIAEEANETDGILEAKVIELAGDMGVELKSEDISVAHRMGKPKEGGRPVIVRFCQRKKKDEIMRNKKKLKNRERKVYVNEDLTSLRAKMMKLAKEQDSVKNVSTRDGSILAWMHTGERPDVINTPDDLYKIGITNPAWDNLGLGHLCRL